MPPSSLSTINLKNLLSVISEQGASDMHLAVGRYPTLRIDGDLVPYMPGKILNPTTIKDLTYSMINEEQKAILEKEKEVDFSYNFDDKARFRINVFYEKGYLAAALRLIPAKIRTVEELDLPSILLDLTRPSQGFVLIVGPSGHGKTTTMAALIDYINQNRNSHIITIEDPIEYLFKPDRCIINQREVYHDATSFSSALRATFREDPDIVMVGEMRDVETISTAITAAETGHLVFATLHTNNASQTIDRIIDSFPAGQQNQIRMQLAGSLLGIVSQRLIPRIDSGRVPALEILIANPAVRNLIREGKSHQLDLVIDTGADAGMVSLNKSLAGLVKNRIISMESAEIYSLNTADLRMLLQK